MSVIKTCQNTAIINLIRLRHILFCIDKVLEKVNGTSLLSSSINCLHQTWFQIVIMAVQP